MFDPTLFAAFVVAATILTITPGVDTAMVLRASASDGPRAGIFAGLGIALGCLVWAGAVSIGLGALLQASELAYAIVKWCGAAYLVWLGVQLILKPRNALTVEPGAARTGATLAFRRGLTTNLLNPKIGVFYVTFLPQFVPHGAPVMAYSLFLAVVHIALSAIWFALLIAATARLGRMLRKAAVVRALDRLTGAIFIGFGVRLAVSRG